MLQRSLLRLPRLDKNYDEVKYLSRRLAPMPQEHFMKARNKAHQNRFRDVGDSFNRVWVSLGGEMRRRRVGRSRDRLDQRYFWRPVPHATQALYLNRYRKKNHSNVRQIPNRLHVTSLDIGAATTGPEFERAGCRRFGGISAAPLPRDWEYRVF
jgi:hypothetical protein